MAILMCVKSETAIQNKVFIGDGIAVYKDDHVFTDHEINMYNFLKLTGTVDEVEARLNQIKPRIGYAFLGPDGKYTFTEIENPQGVLEVYQVEGDSRWYKVISEFQYTINVDQLTAEEKQLLETIDLNHPSVDSFIRKVVKDLTMLPGNDVEVKELRNQTP